jgi:hypothetical protein
MRGLRTLSLLSSAHQVACLAEERAVLRRLLGLTARRLLVDSDRLRPSHRIERILRRRDARATEASLDKRLLSDAWLLRRVSANAGTWGRGLASPLVLHRKPFSKPANLRLTQHTALSGRTGGQRS